MNELEIDAIWVKRLFWLGVGLTVGIFLLNFALVGFGVYGDGIGYYTPLRSLVFDGDLKITNEYEFLSRSASNFGGGVRVSGPIPEYSKYTIGLGLILSPFFALGHLTALLLRGIGIQVATNGLSWPYELFYCLGSITLGIAGLVLCYRAARRFFSRTASLVAVAGVWFASPLTFYLCLEVSMSHAVSQFLISAFLYLCVVTPWQKSRRLQVLLGLLLGFAALVRPQDILFASVPLGIIAYEIGTQLLNNRSNSLNNLTNKNTAIAILLQLVPSAIIVLVVCLLLLPQLLIYSWQYGSFSNIPYLQEGANEGYRASFQWNNPQIINVLFSGFRGLFIWHPILFLSILGLLRFCYRLPRLAGPLLLGFVLQVYLVAAWWCWWQGASFGGRMFSSCSLIFVLGLAALWDCFSSRKWQLTAIIITVFLMGWNVLLVLQYESGMIPPEDPITIANLVKNQLLVIPYFLKHIFER